MKRKRYKIGVKKIDREILNLAKRYSTPRTFEHIRKLFTSVIKVHWEELNEKDIIMASYALKELVRIFRVFSHYENVKKVVIFGSHRISRTSKEYKMAEEFARKITKKGYIVVTGGGGGIMEAGNRGAGKKGIAVAIRLPYEEPNPFVITGEKLINTRYFFTRKLAMVKGSNATVLFPGGFGTYDEIFEVLTLMQTSKSVPRPLIFVETPGKNYWEKLFSFLRKTLLKDGYITEGDFKLFTLVKSADEAVKEIENFHKNFHSLRYGRKYSVIRLNRQLPAQFLKKLGKKYRDILDGPIVPTGPLSIERKTKDVPNVARIRIMYNRKSCGRLLEMIKEINSFDFCESR